MTADTGTQGSPPTARRPGQPQPLLPSAAPQVPAVGLSDTVRWLLGAIAVALLALGCFLAIWQEVHPGHGVSGAGNGIGTAAVFAAGLLAAVGAVNGALPASIKVGDVQLQLQAAQQRTAEAAANLVAAQDPQKALRELPVLKANPSLRWPFTLIDEARRTDPEEWARKIASGQVPVFPDFVGQQETGRPPGS